jgi:2-keto-4-pentenoate hydratase
MTDHENLARRLRAAYAGPTIPPPRDDMILADGKDAYHVQQINIRFWQEQGRRIVGRKVGLTAKSVQAQMGVDQPDYGVLFEDMEIPEGGDLSPRRTLQPRAEAEVAIVLRTDITTSDAGRDDILAAADYAVAAIEVVDSRITDWKISFVDTVADNGSSAFFVLGRERRALDDLDLFTCGMVLEVNGEVASVGAGAACLGHPLNAAAWLARTMAQNGTPLRAGEIILTGALGPMVPLSAGDQIKSTIGGLGSVSFSYGRAAK